MPALLEEKLLFLPLYTVLLQNQGRAKRRQGRAGVGQGRPNLYVHITKGSCWGEEILGWEGKLSIRLLQTHVGNILWLIVGNSSKAEGILIEHATY